MSDVVKGTFNGPCNRTACQKPGATWWNISTRAYYCPSCAHILNRENGEGLCVPHVATLAAPASSPQPEAGGEALTERIRSLRNDANFLRNRNGASKEFWRGYVTALDRVGETATPASAPPSMPFKEAVSTLVKYAKYWVAYGNATAGSADEASQKIEDAERALAALAAPPAGDAGGLEGSKAMAFAVFCPAGHEHDYKVFAERQDADTFAGGEFIEGEEPAEVVPLYPAAGLAASRAGEGERR